MAYEYDWLVIAAGSSQWNSVSGAFTIPLRDMTAATVDVRLWCEGGSWGGQRPWKVTVSRWFDVREVVVPSPDWPKVYGSYSPDTAPKSDELRGLAEYVRGYVIDLLVRERAAVAPDAD